MATANAASVPPMSEQPESLMWGHPKGLWVLCFAELWERFCYYGMRALLAVYVVEQFAKPQAEASRSYGAFTALVYALGVFGGSVADKVLGYRRAIVLGGIIMAVGEFMLMIPTERMFLFGLATLIVGNGLFKPNISTLVGKLYKQGDVRRDAGFTYFYMGINAGAFLAPIACRAVAGAMGAAGKPDYRYGFLTAGFGMLLGVVTFWRGFKHLGDKGLAPAHRQGMGSLGKVVLGAALTVPVIYALLEKKEFAGYAMGILFLVILGYLIWVGVKSDRMTLQRIFALIILLACNIVFWASFEQAGNSLNFFARDQIKLGASEEFPLGGTHGAVLTASATAATVDARVARTEATSITVTYPSPSDPKKKIEATGDVAAGVYALGTPLTVALIDKDKAPRQAEVVAAVPIAVAADAAAKSAGKAAAAAKAAHGGVPDEGLEAAAKKAAADAAEKSVEYVVGPVRPFEWFQSVNAIFIVLLGPLFSFLWVWLDRRNANPSIPFKFGLALVQVGLGFVLLVSSFRGADANGLVPWYLLTGLYLIHTTAELCLSPVGLSMVTKLAPASMTGLVMGAWFLSIANANYVAGWFSALAGAREFDEGVRSGADALKSYSEAFMPIIWLAISAGIITLVLSKVINKLMHGVK